MVTVKIENLSYSYKDSATSVLHDISLSFSSGERVAIIGQNGTGKTTLTKHLNGILTPDTGRVLIDNVNVENKTTAEWASKVGYVFQNPNDQLFLDTVKKELVFGPSHLGIPKKEIQKRIRFVSELVGMQEELAEHPLNLTDSEKKFCAIGAVLAMDPNVVIMDEPTGGQDKSGKYRLAKILEYLKTQQKICIVVSHDMRFVTENFDRIVVMANGHILLDGAPKEVFSNPQVLKEAFVTPPPITDLAQKLGWETTILSISEFIEELKKRVQ